MMQFVDRAQILVVGGHGGDGCSAMFKQPFSRYPRRFGGDGGDGGHVVIVADPQLTTLLDFQFRHEFRATRGRHGQGNTKTGKRGADCLIRVPVGTLLYHDETHEIVRDLIRPGERLVIAQGGRGGLGNAATGDEALPGQAGEQRRLRLELKLLADVGFVGFPNAGKSSLLARISTARPTIAPYPFTTKTPMLGVVSAGPECVFVACDIPGLIEGAHEGRGLGIQFLRHIERTMVLIYVIDLAGVDGRNPLEDFGKLREELRAYSPILNERPFLMAANKMDLPEAQARFAELQASAPAPVYPISCATGQGIAKLVQAAWAEVQQLRQAGIPPKERW